MGVSKPEDSMKVGALGNREVQAPVEKRGDCGIGWVRASECIGSHRGWVRV